MLNAVRIRPALASLRLLHSPLLPSPSTRRPTRAAGSRPQSSSGRARDGSVPVPSPCSAMQHPSASAAAAIDSRTSSCSRKVRAPCSAVRDAPCCTGVQQRRRRAPSPRHSSQRGSAVPGLSPAVRPRPRDRTVLGVLSYAAATCFQEIRRLGMQTRASQSCRASVTAAVSVPSLPFAARQPRLHPKTRRPPSPRPSPARYCAGPAPLAGPDAAQPPSPQQSVVKRLRGVRVGCSASLRPAFVSRLRGVQCAVLCDYQCLCDTE